jgi:hypothetical protein
MSATASHNSSDSGSSKRSRGISRGGRCQSTALAFGRVGETSPDVVGRQLREIGQNLRFRHATCQIAQDVANRNASASNARLTKSDGRIRSDSVEQVHCRSLLRKHPVLGLTVLAALKIAWFGFVMAVWVENLGRPNAAFQPRRLMVGSPRLQTIATYVAGCSGSRN